MGSRRRNKKRYPRRYCPLESFECIGMNEKGQGLVEYKNKKFIVDEMLPGEIGKIIVFYEDEFGGEARVILLEKESPVRALPLNHPKMQLGSYHVAHMKDDAQDEWKQKRVNDTFNYESLPIKVGARINYRNKIVLFDGGFRPPGKGRRFTITPEPGQFDLMDVDFEKYRDVPGNLIIRRLDEEITGVPGEDKSAIHTMLGKKFSVGLNSFYQVNNEMAEIAYKDIISEINNGDVVYDLFGGAATIGIHISDKASKVYSVELNRDSHKDAIKNIELNKIENVEPILGDANKWVVENNKKADVVIFDPARSGISEESAKAINNSGINKIIYLSCNIETQKRDIDRMENYKIVKMQPYDFFPQTYHVENLIVLEKK